MGGNNTTGVPEVQSVRVCVVFDRTDGTIHHIHEVVTLYGGEESSDDVRRRALDLAAELGPEGMDAAELEALQVDPAALEPGRRYAVDPGSRELRAID